jgi:cobalt-zinc-cadmium efflux system membrane fusion protein
MDPAETRQSQPRLFKSHPADGSDRKPLSGHPNTYVDTPLPQPARRPRARIVRATATIIAASGVLTGVYLEYGKNHGLERSAREERRLEKTQSVVPRIDLIDSETLGYQASGDSTTPIKLAAAVQPSHSRKLRVRGSLAIDPNRLIHVHVRFPGQVVEFGTTTSTTGTLRPLSTLDPVTRGQRIGVIWSKDYGEKKSELVDALARLRLDRQTLTRLERLAETGATSERAVREVRRNVEVGEIAVFRAERTLRSWLATDQEIDLIKAESLLIHRQEELQTAHSSDWARVEITSPMDGLIIEKNVSIGDIVDTNDDLFKVADLSVLSMWLHTYEEDLPAILQLSLPLGVRVRLPTNQELGELAGRIDRVGQIIDPNEHMALLIGSIANPQGKLRAGQFVSVEIDLPPEPDVVAIPSTALADAGNDSVVYVQEDARIPRLKRRHVYVVRRLSDQIQVLSTLSADQRERGFQELHLGERVVVGGVLELEQYLEEQRGTGAK